MVLFTLVVNSVELSKSGVKGRNLAISEETPNLTQGHCKRLFSLGGFDLASIFVVPGFQFRVVAKHNVLNFFLHISWVLLVFCQVRDVEQALVGVCLDFFAGCKTSFCLGGVGFNLAFFEWGARGSLWDHTVNHAVFLEGAFVFGTVFESEFTLTLFVVLNPVALVLRTIGVVECALAVAEAVMPVTNVSVS